MATAEVKQAMASLRQNGTRTNGLDSKATSFAPVQASRDEGRA